MSVAESQPRRIHDRPPTHETVDTSMHVVIVDDHDRLRKSYEQMVCPQDSFSSFPNGRAAWEWFQENPGKANLLWTDNSMPEMGGPALIEKVRGQDKEVFIALVTMNADVFDKPELLEKMGVNMLVDKMEGDSFRRFEDARKTILQRREEDRSSAV